MSVVVLLSTMSFTLDMHYCGDGLVDTTIISKTKTCGMETGMINSDLDCSVSKKDCCTNKQLLVEHQDLETSFVVLDVLTINQQLFFASFVYSYINLFEGLKENKTSYSNYYPPYVVRNIYKIDETYLI